MTDFTPPSGPPPPKVPEGWKAVWNDQYSEYFYVNIYTKKSQWDKPTSPVYPPGEAPDAPPEGPPPSYSSGPGAPTDPSSEKRLGSNNPYGAGASPQPHHDTSEDEKLARRLQEEEEARARSGAGGGGGAANAYYEQGTGGGYPPPGGSSQYASNQATGLRPEYGSQDKGKSRSFLGKLMGKAGGSSSTSYGAHPQQQQHYGGYPQQGGYYQQGGYGQQYGGYGGYPQQQMYGRPPRKGGLGTGGAAALGLGGGLLAGGLIGEAMGDAGDHGDYGDGGDGGGDFGGDGGGDFGGGDFGGGGDF